MPPVRTYILSNKKKIINFPSPYSTVNSFWIYEEDLLNLSAQTLLFQEVFDLFTNEDKEQLLFSEVAEEREMAKKWIMKQAGNDAV